MQNRVAVDFNLNQKCEKRCFFSLLYVSPKRHFRNELRMHVVAEGENEKAISTGIGLDSFVMIEFDLIRTTESGEDATLKADSEHQTGEQVSSGSSLDRERKLSEPGRAELSVDYVRDAFVRHRDEEGRQAWRSLQFTLRWMTRTMGLLYLNLISS